MNIKLYNVWYTKTITAGQNVQRFLSTSDLKNNTMKHPVGAGDLYFNYFNIMGRDIFIFQSRLISDKILKIMGGGFPMPPLQPGLIKYILLILSEFYQN